MNEELKNDEKIHTKSEEAIRKAELRSARYASFLEESGLVKNDDKKNKQKEEISRLYGSISKPVQSPKSEDLNKDIDGIKNFGNTSQDIKKFELNKLRNKSKTSGKSFGKFNFGRTKFLIAQAQRRIKRHERPIWILNFIIALSLDFVVDIIAFVPYVGWIIGAVLAFCGGLYLTISLWRTGNRKTRTKKRVMRVAMLILDAIPYISILPLSTATVLVAYNDSKKASDKAKVTLAELQENNPELVIS